MLHHLADHPTSQIPGASSHHHPFLSLGDLRAIFEQAALRKSFSLRKGVDLGHDVQLDGAVKG